MHYHTTCLAVAVASPEQTSKLILTKTSLLELEPCCSQHWSFNHLKQKLQSSYTVSMNENIDENDNDNLESRHRKELKAWEGEKRAALKKARATKGKKKPKIWSRVSKPNMKPN